MKNLLYFLFPLLVFFGCSNDTYVLSQKAWMQPNGKVKVLSTIAMIDDLVKQVGGNYVDSHTLIKGELDPHSYQLVKGDDEKLAFADLIFYNGLGLEHGPSLQKHLHDDKKSIGLGDIIKEKNPELILVVNGQTDPHIWLDISLWAKSIPSIVEALSKKDPSHAAEYKANGEVLGKTLLTTHDQIKQLLHSVPESKRYLVTSHDAFNYFTRAYLSTENETTMDQWQKRFAAPEGLAPESQLSTTDIKNIISHLRQYNISVLFPESNVNKDSIRKIVDAGKQEGMDLRISEIYLYADAMGRPGSDGDTYIKMINHDANTIVHYLK